MTERYGPGHTDVEDLLGAYALDAVPEDERRLVEEHLAVCGPCRREAMEHRETVALLSEGGAPPVAVWDRIAGELEASPVDLARRREARRPGRWSTRLVAAAAAIVIAALSVTVVWQGRRLDRLDRLTEERALLEAAEAAVADPDARTTALRSGDGGVVVSAVLLPDGRGYLYRGDLRPLPAGRTYQLWALGEADPISIGVLGRDPGVVPFVVDPGISGLAISEEVAGGAVAPSDPLAAGEFRTS